MGIAPLMRYDIGLGFNISLHRPMPVQVVRRYIQHGGYLWTYAHQFQLETGEFHHNPVLLLYCG
jgi:hypothetical protein